MPETSPGRRFREALARPDILQLPGAHSDMAAKSAAAARARRDLVAITRADTAGSEGIESAVARSKLYVEAGADAILPKALTSVEMFREMRAAPAST